MYMWSVYLVLLPSVFAFLLETNTPKNSTGGYLTITRFLEAQKQQHIETEALRKTTDDTIAVLTSQLQSKFTDLEKKLIGDVKKNESCRVVDELEKKILELENNQTNMLSELKITQEDNKQLKDQISSLVNETYHVDQRMKKIEQLKNIQSLQDLQTVKQQIQSINAKTASLSLNQFARNQDFLALYNQTSFGLFNADNRLQHLESLMNVSLTNVTITQQHVTDRFVAMEDRLQHFEEYTNTSFTRLNTNTAALQTQITNNKRKVAITACQIGNANEVAGYIVKFGKVKTNIGIRNISSFTSSGKFKCEYEGLYTLSVSLTAFDTLINYGVYLNGNIFTSVYERNNKVLYQRGTTTVVVNLHPNDVIWVQLSEAMYVDVTNSCIAIVMIK